MGISAPKSKSADPCPARRCRSPLQRKIDNMTRMMLDGGRASGEGAKPKRENRRETWCPGAGGWPGNSNCVVTLTAWLHAERGLLTRYGMPPTHLALQPARASGHWCPTWRSCWRRMRRALLLQRPARAAAVATALHCCAPSGRAWAAAWPAAAARRHTSSSARVRGGRVAAAALGEQLASRWSGMHHSAFQHCPPAP